MFSASPKPRVPAATLAEVLAQAVAGDEGRAHPPGGQEAQGRHADRENGRLGVFGQRQRVLGALEAQLAERLSERGIGLSERIPANRKRLREGLSHADLLRALSREDEGNHW